MVQTQVDCDSPLFASVSYLTPHKIAVVALILLYSEGLIPAKHKVDVLKVIVDHINNPTQHDDDDDGDGRVKFWSRLDNFKQSLCSNAGTCVYEMLIDKAWSLSDLDALYTFMQNCRGYISNTSGWTVKEAGSVLSKGQESSVRRKIKLSRDSFLGLFVRRCCLVFDQMSFDAVLLLWRSFVSFRESTKDPSKGDNNHDESVLELLSNPSIRNLLQPDVSSIVAVDDLERVFESQVDTLQRNGATMKPGLRKQLAQYANSCPSLPPTIHYAQYLDAWKAGDYHAAFDLLHRYFDHTMYNRESSFYQYALLNLAILQAEFGCYKEAIRAVHETVATAREAHDKECLNFALSFLYHLEIEHPSEFDDDLDTEQILLHLKSKTKDRSMVALQSLVFLNEAAQALSNGESLVDVFEAVTKASYINTMASNSRGLVPQLLFESSMWLRLGVPRLAQTLLKVAHKDNDESKNTNPLIDIIRVACQMAQMHAQQGEYDQALNDINAVEEMASRSVSLFHYWKSRVLLLSFQRTLDRGLYAHCKEILQEVKMLDPSDRGTKTDISLCEIELCIQIGEHGRACDLIQDGLVKCRTDKADIQCRIRYMILQVRNFISINQISKAYSTAIRTFILSQESSIIPLQIESICLISRIQILLKVPYKAVNLLDCYVSIIMECGICRIIGQAFEILADGLLMIAKIENYGSILVKDRENDDVVLKSLYRIARYLTQAQSHYDKIHDYNNLYKIKSKLSLLASLLGDNQSHSKFKSQANALLHNLQLSKDAPLH